MVNKSLIYYGPKIWNFLPFHVKASENLKAFKNIKNWNGITRDQHLFIFCARTIFMQRKLFAFNESMIKDI